MQIRKKSAVIAAILMSSVLAFSACSKDSALKKATNQAKESCEASALKAEKDIKARTAAASTANGGDAGKPITGGELVDYQNFGAGDAANIDPALATELSGAQVGVLLFDGLTDYDPVTGEVRNALADKIDVSKDGKTYTFHIRDTKFSNGDPVLPSSFKRGWERVLDPAMASDLTYHFDHIVGASDIADGKTKTLSGVTADNEKMTLTVKLDARTPFFKEVVAHPAYSPVPESVVNALPDQTKWSQGVMIGNGPYKMVAPWAHGDQIALEANPEYWGGPENHAPYIPKLTFKISKDVDASYKSFEAGDGLTAQIPSGGFAKAVKKYPNSNSIDPTLGVYYMIFNMKDKAVGGDNNLKFRQAVSVAIDKNQINKDAYDGSRAVASGIVPPNMPGYKAGLGCPYAGQSTPNADLAKKLLQEWKDDGNTQKKTLLVSYNNDGGHEDVINDIVQDLNAVGIKAKGDPRNGDTYFTELNDHQFVFARSGWIADYIAYDNMIYSLFHTGAGDNSGAYSNPEVDQKLDDARKQVDTDKSNADYQEAERLVLEDAPAIPITWYTNTVVYSPKLANFHQSTLQFVNYEDMWIKK